MNSIIEGFLLGIGLIVAIGSQNAFVLRQGAMGKHLLALALTCIFCDALLIAIGSLGIGGFIAKTHWLRLFLMGGGVIFLTWYGIASLIRMVKGSALLVSKEEEQNSGVGRVILTAIAFSLINPNALLDTVVLIGGLAAQYDYPSQRAGFALGAFGASIIWFFSLTYLAKFMQPIFCKRLTARIFEGCVAAIMFVLAGSLIWREFH